MQGCFNAFAAGNLIYSALVEMMAEDFSAGHRSAGQKALMMSTLGIGLLTMAILAMYA